jgi:hypothetical protein
MDSQQIRPCDPTQQAHREQGEYLRKRGIHMARLHLADRAPLHPSPDDLTAIV